MKNRKKIVEIILLLLIVAAGIGLIRNFAGMEVRYERFHMEGISYEKRW